MSRRLPLRIHMNPRGFPRILLLGILAMILNGFSFASTNDDPPPPGQAEFPPPVPTQHPVETLCVTTRCPPVVTECPEEYTKCPEYSTWCPAQWTVCPEQDTVCPEFETICPKAKVTVCPWQETRCPKVDTKCPKSPTECGGSTKCWFTPNCLAYSRPVPPCPLTASLLR